MPKEIFTKKQIFTLPNMITMVRILLIPFFIWLYAVKKEYLAAAVVILASWLTDFLDGWIARTFHLISDFGKMLDPLADKLTQGSVFLCLLGRYPLMLYALILFLIFEISKMVSGFAYVKESRKVMSAKWYGKVNTACIYLMTLALLLIPDLNPTIANILIILICVVMVLSSLLYVFIFRKNAVSSRNIQNDRNPQPSDSQPSDSQPSDPQPSDSQLSDPQPSDSQKNNPQKVD